MTAQYKLVAYVCIGQKVVPAKKHVPMDTHYVFCNKDSFIEDYE